MGGGGGGEGMKKKKKKKRRISTPTIASLFNVEYRIIYI